MCPSFELSLCVSFQFYLKDILLLSKSPLGHLQDAFISLNTLIKQTEHLNLDQILVVKENLNLKRL